MNLAKAVGLVGLAILVSAFSVGCCDKEKSTIGQLTQENLDLSTQNEALRNDLNSAKDRENEMANELYAAQQAGKAVKAPTGVHPIGGATAGGCERGLIGDRVTVGSDLLFAPGQAKLTDSGRRELDKIASALKSTYAGLPVRVYGYTDSDPVVKTRNLWTDNLDLSANRAMAVTRYLWSRGIAKDRIETVAMGETHFVGPNSSKAAKVKNRRVEIIVIKSK